MQLTWPDLQHIIIFEGTCCSSSVSAGCFSDWEVLKREAQVARRNRHVRVRAISFWSKSHASPELPHSPTAVAVSFASKKVFSECVCDFQTRSGFESSPVIACRSTPSQVETHNFLRYNTCADSRSGSSSVRTFYMGKWGSRTKTQGASDNQEMPGGSTLFRLGTLLFYNVKHFPTAVAVPVLTK